MSRSASQPPQPDPQQPGHSREGSVDRQPAVQPPAVNDAGEANVARAPADAGTSIQTSAAVFGWTRGDRQFALIAGVAILALLLAHWGRLTWRGTPAVEIQRLETAANQFQLDINEATWVEWMQLEGVGEALSRRIVNNRDENGPFESIDDVERVRGIGPKRLAQLRPWLLCADCPRQSATNDADDR